MIRLSQPRSFNKFLYFALLAGIFVFGMQRQANAAMPAELAQAVEQIYNVKFESARATVNTYINRTPRDPAGYIVRGMLNEWDQVVNNKKKALNAIIMADYQKAVDFGEQALEKSPEDAGKMIMLGNAHMYLAKKYVDNGSKMRGGGELKKAKELMLAAIAKDPNNYDAYMALGVFNYFSANVPSGFKWLAALLGFNGNKADGFNYLKKATENKNITQGDAGFLLVYIYSVKEKNYGAALQYNTMLKTRYPDNPAFQYETGELLFHQKNYAQSISTATNFLGFCKSKGQGYCSKKYLFMANHVIAKSYFKQGNIAVIKPFVDEAIKHNEDQYKDRTVDLDLWQGFLAKEKGDKAKADEFFRKVEAHKSENGEAWQAAEKEIAAL
jgi:tetratricopeptide (TPR) repeat protein